MKFFLAVVAVSAALFCLYVRFSPSEEARWHRDPQQANDPGLGGILLLPGQGAPTGNLSDLDEIAMHTPRTKQFGGSVQKGMITYVTRSAFWGFPDYTTVLALPQPDGTSVLVFHGRLRFGRKDFGVNKARVTGWIKALKAF
ncbi:MAG: DUF1499 domain-containing protein [Pseudoruegeria sp.]